jgi:hypothetical protein
MIVHVRRLARLVLPQLFSAIVISCASPSGRNQAMVPNSIAPPHLLSLPPPYPADFASNTYASLLLECTVTEKGTATGCISLDSSSSPIALDAAFRWLADPATHFAPATHEGHPVSARHKMYVRFGYNTKRTPAQISAVYEWPNFYPTFPKSYSHNKRKGIVGTVNYHFTVAPDGLPTDAHVDSVDGGDKFGVSVLSWLSSGCVHVRPNFEDATPIATSSPSETVRFNVGN